MKLDVSSRIPIELETVPDFDCYCDPESETTLVTIDSSLMWLGVIKNAESEFSE